MQDDYDSQPGSPGPSKRRRYSRVSRACNECRLRKIRCNGRQPCEPCGDFERHCTFTSTKGQKVAGAPRTKILEDRLRRARSLIAKLQSRNPSSISAAEMSNVFDSPPGSPSSVSDTTGATDESTGEHLESMMDGRGRLLLNPKSATYYGGGSSLAFLQRTYELFSQNSPPIGPINLELPQSTFSDLFDGHFWDKSSTQIEISPPEILPPRRITLELLGVFFRNANHLFQFLHEPSFRSQVDRIYDLDPLDFGELDHDFLPLFHSVIAVGYLFNHKMHQKHGCKASLDQANRYFFSAHRMIDLNRCRDILGLQTILVLALFLKSTSRLATAHTLLGVAVSASLRMGLHSQTSSSGLTPLAREIKIRTFWTMVKLDIFCSGILGLPMMVDLTYVDQLRPSALCRDYSDEKSGGFVSLSSRRAAAASAHYLELLIIMRRMLKKIYPRTDEDVDDKDLSKAFAFNNAFVDEVKDEFKTWREGLADVLGPSEGQDSMSSTVYELEMVHNCGHLILYGPFLHYLTKTKDESPPDPRLLNCATSCVKISRFTILRSEEMFSQGFLEPSSWHAIYIILLSLVTLVYFLATQHGNREYMAIKKEAERGIRLLHGTSCLDSGSRKCLDALKVLIAKQATLVDLDVEKLSEGVKPLCQTKSPHPDEHHNAQQKQSRHEHDTHLSWVDGRVNDSTHRLPMQVDSNRQFPYRSQSYDDSAVPMNSNPPISPFHQSQYDSYNKQHSMWDQSTASVDPTHHSYPNASAFPYQTQSAQSFRVKYGENEMERSHLQDSAWSFPPGTGYERGRSRWEDGRQPPTPYELSPNDLSAFMGNKSRE